MEDIRNKDWFKILIGIVSLVALIFAIQNIDSSNTAFRNNKFSYILLFFLGIFFYVFFYYYLKKIPKNKNAENEMNFLKVLLPTSLAILSLLYALSSGFFSIQKANLEFDKNELTIEKRKLAKDTSLLKGAIKDLGDSNSVLINEKDSLSEIITLLKLQINDKSKIEIDNARLSIENKKLKIAQEATRQMHIADISNIDFGNREVYFLIKNQRGKILDITEIGIEWDDSQNRVPQLNFNSQTSQYLWKIPDYLFKNNKKLSKIEFNFSFINSSLTDNEINEFRRINGGFEIAICGAQYELIVYQ